MREVFAESCGKELSGGRMADRGGKFQHGLKGLMSGSTCSEKGEEWG